MKGIIHVWAEVLDGRSALDALMAMGWVSALLVAVCLCIVALRVVALVTE